jgi:N-acetylglucosamine-6-sulfatase
MQRPSRAARAALPLLVVLAVAVLAPVATAASGAKTGLHDARYCEILVLKGVPPTAKADVWNTIGQNRCPQAWWKSLDAGRLARELGATLVVLNGPRHWLMDAASGRTGGVRSFHGQTLTKVATIPIRTAADLARTPYTDRTIARRNLWRWKAGRTVFELVAPGGDVYVMQAYSQIVDPALTLAQLPALGGRLKLPEGWRYRTRRLRRPLVLGAAGRATITQDELQNTYQLARTVPRRGRAVRHAVAIRGMTRNVPPSTAGTLEDHGTLAGTPFGPGTIVLVGRLTGGRLEASIRMRFARGSVLGTASMPFTIADGRISFNGTARLTGGTGAYRGITSGTLQAADTNTLDGQNGRVTVTGFARYRATAPGKGRAVPAAPRATRRNVVTIMTDDQDFRSMWAMPKTRRLVARSGTTFATSSVSFPLCCPARATYYTGQYAHNHGVKWNTFPLGGFYRLKQAETLPVWLRRAGYRTIHIGKYLNQTDERDPREVPLGWTDYLGGVDPSTYDYYGMTLNHNGKLVTYPREPRFYSTDVYAGLAEREIRRASRARTPFFLNVAPNAPHTVSVASNAEIEGTPALPPPRYATRFATTPLPQLPNFNEADVSDKPAFLPSAFPMLTPTDVAELTAQYRGRMGALLGVDDLVERVVKALKRAGVYRNTDIIFTSDNGWILGEHRLVDPTSQDGTATGVKFFPFEGSSRVPLMATGPDFPAGRTVRGPVVNADLTPTIEDITGVRPTLPQDGVSLVAAARRPSRLDGRGVLLETFPNPRGAPPYQSIRTERYRYDRYTTGDEQLYDLERDPYELESRHADPRYARIKAILARGLARLAACKGKGCRVDVGRLPAPGG